MISDLVRDLLQIIQDRFGTGRVKGVGHVQFTIGDMLPVQFLQQHPQRIPMTGYDRIQRSIHCGYSEFGSDLVDQCTCDGFLGEYRDHGVPKVFTEERRRAPVIRPAPTTTLARALATKRPVQTADVRDYPDAPSGYTSGALAKLAGARTLLTVPMLKENEPIGAIVIYRTEVRPFSDKQMELVKNFAAQAVIAIENTRLLNELREALEQQTATSEVLQVISSSPGELQPVFDAMLANATRICDAKFATLYLRDADVFRAVAATHDAPLAYLEARKPGMQVQPPSDTPLGHGRLRQSALCGRYRG